ISNKEGKLVIGSTIWARVLAAAGVLMAAVWAAVGIALVVRGWPSIWSVLLGLGLFAFMALLLAVSGVKLVFSDVVVLDKEKGVLVYRRFLWPARLDLKRITRVVVHTRGPFRRPSVRPEEPDEIYWEYDLLLECSGAAPLPVLDGGGTGEILSVAEAVCE